MLVASADGSADGSLDAEDTVDVGKLTLGMESVVSGEASVVVGKNEVGSGTSVMNGVDSVVLVAIGTVSLAAKAVRARVKQPKSGADEYSTNSAPDDVPQNTASPSPNEKSGLEKKIPPSKIAVHVVAISGLVVKRLKAPFPLARSVEEAPTNCSPAMRKPSDRVNLVA